MNIRIICVGRLKEDYLKKGMEICKKDICKFHTFEVVELEDEETPDGASEAVCEKIIEKEGQRILGKIQDQDYVIALCIEGKQWTSEMFSSKLMQIKNSGREQIDFVIGGSLGLHKNVIRRSNEQISFSKMTFPHQLMRVILAEQIAYCIKK